MAHSDAVRVRSTVLRVRSTVGHAAGTAAAREQMCFARPSKLARTTMRVHWKHNYTMFMMLLKPNSQLMRYPISALWRNEMCMYIVVSVDRNYDLFPNPFRFHLLLYLPHLLYTLWITEVYCSFIHLASSKCSGCLSS